MDEINTTRVCCLTWIAVLHNPSSLTFFKDLQISLGYHHHNETLISQGKHVTHVLNLCGHLIWQTQPLLQSHILSSKVK